MMSGSSLEVRRDQLMPSTYMIMSPSILALRILLLRNVLSRTLQDIFTSKECLDCGILYPLCTVKHQSYQIKSNQINMIVSVAVVLVKNNLFCDRVHLLLLSLSSECWHNQGNVNSTVITHTQCVCSIDKSTDYSCNKYS